MVAKESPMSRPCFGIALILCCLCSSRVVWGEEPKWTPIIDLRARWEVFDTPAASQSRDRTYDFLVVRARVGGEVWWRQQLGLRALVQATTTTDLPNSAGFASGLTYFSTNGGETTPDQVDLAELALTWKPKNWTLTLGRQAFAEGAGRSTGVAHLDWLRTRRLAERLVGNLDFSNVGRRFDGLVINGALEKGTFEAFGLRPTAGAFNYLDAFDRLDIDVFGASWSSAYGELLPRGTVRVFAIDYHDERRVTQAANSGDVDLTTYGASALFGEASWNALIWVALQEGELGRREHSSQALLIDLGKRFTGVRGEPSLHLCFEQADGGGDSGENENFFNILPTNHKFYGALDYQAFSNVRDVALEARWSPSKTVSAVAAVHDFSLVDRGQPWFGGSGAFSDRELGYLSRRPVSGRFKSDNLGRELDLAFTWQVRKEVALKLEGGLFWGGEAAEEVLPSAADGSWVSLEATYRK
jgi:Alginate export